MLDNGRRLEMILGGGVPKEDHDGEVLPSNEAERLTRRSNRRLASLFPPLQMIRIPQKIATRALARRG